MGFFKKVKKVIKKATIIGSGGKVIGDVVGGLTGGLLGGGKDDASGAINAATAQAESAQKQAAEQAALARQQAEQQAQQLQLMQTNMATDLRGENLNSVVAGGGATAADVNAAPDPLKRKKASGLSTTLGLA